MTAQETDRTLLIVDDDKAFLARLARAMETRGYQVTPAESVAEAWQRWAAGHRPSP